VHYMDKRLQELGWQVTCVCVCVCVCETGDGGIAQGGHERRQVLLHLNYKF
jgi:hypothetical protein